MGADLVHFSVAVQFNVAGRQPDALHQPDSRAHVPAAHAGPPPHQLPAVEAEQVAVNGVACRDGVAPAVVTRRLRQHHTHDRQQGGPPQTAAPRASGQTRVHNADLHLSVSSHLGHGDLLRDHHRCTELGRAAVTHSDKEQSASAQGAGDHVVRQVLYADHTGL